MHLNRLFFQNAIVIGLFISSNFTSTAAVANKVHACFNDPHQIMTTSHVVSRLEARMWNRELKISYISINNIILTHFTKIFLIIFMIMLHIIGPISETAFNNSSFFFSPTYYSIIPQDTIRCDAKPCLVIFYYATWQIPIFFWHFGYEHPLLYQQNCVYVLY